MPTDEVFDILPQDAAWGHTMAQDADGLDLYYVRRGHGSPAVLLPPTAICVSSYVRLAVGLFLHRASVAMIYQIEGSSRWVTFAQ
jgi:hypothetical protein